MSWLTLKTRSRTRSRTQPKSGHYNATVLRSTETRTPRPSKRSTLFLLTLPLICLTAMDNMKAQLKRSPSTVPVPLVWRVCCLRCGLGALILRPKLTGWEYQTLAGHITTAQSGVHIFYQCTHSERPSIFALDVTRLHTIKPADILSLITH